MQGNNGKVGLAAGFNTAAQNCPWWQVDLGAAYIVGHVVVHDRIDAKPEEFDVSISGGLDGLSWEILSVQTVKGDKRAMSCGVPDKTWARFIRVARIGFGELHLDEIEVFGYRKANYIGLRPAAVNEPRIACLMMQKDERILLRPWLLHHGRLFGYQNLHVLDNGSTDTQVRTTLREFAAYGVNVTWEFDTPGHFNAKGFYVGEIIRGLRNARAHDLALPLDCDEFAAVTTADGIRCRREDVSAELRRIYLGGRVARTNQCVYNLPGSLTWFKYAYHQKCIVPIALFEEIDHGFHKARIAEGDDYGATAMTYLHLHLRPFAHLLDGAVDKLRPWVDASDRAALYEYDGVGAHLTKYFFMSAQDYRGYDVNPGAVAFLYDDFLNGLGTQADQTAFSEGWA